MSTVTESTMSSPILPSTTSDPVSILPRFSDEIFLRIFEHIDDRGLLPLAVLSKHIHDLALLSYLGRYDITESDVANGSFPQVSTSGAFPVFCVGRFITHLDALHLLFDTTPNMNRDIRALMRLVLRLPPVKSVDLQFTHPVVSEMLRSDCEQNFIFTLLSPYRARPAVIVSPWGLRIIRPPNSVRKGLPRILSDLKKLLVSDRVTTGDLIQEGQFREAQTLLRISFTLQVRVSSTLSIRGFDPSTPAALGSITVYRADSIEDFRFPPNLLPAEASAVFENLTLPLLRDVDMAFPTIPYTSFSDFLSRHPKLQRFTVRGPYNQSMERIVPTPSHDAHLPSDALPNVEYIRGTAPFLAWILSPDHRNPLQNLTGVSLDLHEHKGKWEAYTVALRGLAIHPAIRMLTVFVYEWFPWRTAPERLKAAKTRASVSAPHSPAHVDAQGEPEQNVRNISDLRVTFKTRHLGAFTSVLVPLALWVKLWPAVQELSLFAALPAAETSAAIERECPGIRVTVLELKPSDYTSRFHRRES